MSAVSTAPAESPDKGRRKTKKAKQRTKSQPKQAKPAPAQSTNRPIKLLREREVLARVGLRLTRFKELVESGDFPAPVHITPGGRALGYVESEVEEFIESRIRARDEVA